MSARATIFREIRKVAQEHNKELAPLSDQLPLLESGLDSLCLAVLIVRLDDALGSDPFTASPNLVPVTLGDFVSAYENAAGCRSADAPSADSLSQ
jgi:hypothetical protein